MTIATSLYIYIIFLGFIGFLISFYLAHKKRTKEDLVCPFKGKCDFVIHSRHSRFFGVPVEFGGLAYYALIAIFYAFALINPVMISEQVAFFAVVFSGLAAVFSLYLTGLQAFVIKHWCTWCLMSAIVSILIFILSILGMHVDLLYLFSTFHAELLIAHIVAFALAFGGAVMIDVFLFKFLKDKKVSTFEEDVLHTHMQFIWFFLGVVVLTGIGLYGPNFTAVQVSDQLQMVLLLLVILFVNNLVLHFGILPRLIEHSSKRPSQERDHKLTMLRSWAFAAGAVSTISWAFAFLLGTVGFAPFTFMSMLGTYVIMLGLGVLVSQVTAAHSA